MVASSLEPQTVLDRIVGSATDLLGADSGDILLWDRGRDVLRVVAVSDFPPEMIGFESPFGTGLSSQAILAQRTIEVEDYRTYPHRIRALDHYDFGSVLCSPLLFRGAAIGALNVHARGRRLRFPPGSVDLLAAFAGHAAIAIDHARRYDNEVTLGRELARANRELTRVLTMQQRLAGHILAGGDPQGLAALLARDLGRTVRIEDHLHRSVAAAGPDGQPAEAATSGADGPPGMTVPLQVGRELAGFLVLPDAGPLDPVDRALVDAAATGAALAFARTRAAIEVEERLRGAALADLLSGAYGSDDAISARLARSGYDLDRPRRPVVLRLAPAATGDADEPLNAGLARVRDRLGGRGPRVLSTTHGGVVVVLVQHDGPASALEGLARELLDAIEPDARAPHGIAPTAAIGPVCRTPGDYAAGVRAAREAADLFVRLGRSGEVVDVDRLGAYRLLLQAADRPELEAYVRSRLGPLFERGPAGLELLRTLRIHLDAGGNQRRTAERAVVHVNTVADRLHRIERRLGVDLDDPAAVFDLTLAFRIMDVLGLGAAEPVVR